LIAFSELERIREEMAVAYFKVLSQYSSGEIEESDKSLSQHSQWTG
jgi:hypothetical protein